MEDFIKLCKSRVENDDLEGLQKLYQEYLDEDFAWEYAYQKIYLHACLKKKQEIAKWIESLYELMDPIQQIALRQMFAYGRYLLAK